MARWSRNVLFLRSSRLRAFVPSRLCRHRDDRTFKGIMPTVAPTAYVDATAQVIGDVAHRRREQRVDERRHPRRCQPHPHRRAHQHPGRHIVHVMREHAPDDHRRRRHDRPLAVVHGCTIEDRVPDRHGRDPAQRRRVGHDSIVAAGTLLTEGSVVPPRSLVMGSPGKVKRPLTDEEVRVDPEYGRQLRRLPPRLHGRATVNA